MASTYEPIQTQTVSGGSTTTITFSSIPSTYTDLVLVLNGNTAGPSTIRMWFNNDQTALYSWNGTVGRTTITARGSTAANEVVIGGYQNYWPDSATDRATATINILQYKNTSVFKSFLSRDSDMYGVGESGQYGGVYRSTSAINRIDLYTGYFSYYFRAGTTATLYGIKAA